jgi:hypothetical protein
MLHAFQENVLRDLGLLVLAAIVDGEHKLGDLAADTEPIMIGSAYTISKNAAATSAAHHPTVAFRQQHYHQPCHWFLMPLAKADLSAFHCILPMPQAMPCHPWQAGAEWM